jgi:hypothetical protein
MRNFGTRSSDVRYVPASFTEIKQRQFFKEITQNGSPSLKTAGEVNIYGGGRFIQTRREPADGGFYIRLSNVTIVG